MIKRVITLEELNGNEAIFTTKVKTTLPKKFTEGMTNEQIFNSLYTVVKNLKVTTTDAAGVEKTIDVVTLGIAVGMRDNPENKDLYVLESITEKGNANVFIVKIKCPIRLSKPQDYEVGQRYETYVEPQVHGKGFAIFTAPKLIVDEKIGLEII